MSTEEKKKKKLPLENRMLPLRLITSVPTDSDLSSYMRVSSIDTRSLGDEHSRVYTPAQILSD